MQKIAIYGAGGFGRETELLIKQINQNTPTWNFIGFFDDNIKTETNYLGGIETINAIEEPLNVVIAIADGSIRKKIVKNIVNSNIKFPTLIHPSVIYDQEELIKGKGTVITALSIFTTNIKIGDFAIINLNCTIGHDVEIGHYTSIMPGANISGNVKIGTETLIGTGTQILQNVSVGNNCKVGAGAVVIDDVAEGKTVVGVPAKRINK